MHCLTASQERCSQRSIAQEAWNMSVYATSNRVKPIAVESRPNHCIWAGCVSQTALKGSFDLSRWVGVGAFKAWDNTVPFDAMHITAWGAIGWNEELDLCPDSLFPVHGTHWQDRRGIIPGSLREGARMPVICRFSGIVIRLYFSEHGTPHFTDLSGSPASLRYG